MNIAGKKKRITVLICIAGVCGCFAQDAVKPLGTLPARGEPGIAEQLVTKRKFWAGEFRQPTPGELEFPADIRHVRVESSTGEFKFLHDPAIVEHGKELYVAWYNCPEHEIVGKSSIRGRRSRDGGATWSDVETLVEDENNEGIFHVPVQLLSEKGVLYAFAGRMTGHDLIKTCDVYTLDETTGEWRHHGKIADLFLPNCQPVRMDDGNWVMAGRVATEPGKKPHLPAVAISSGDDLRKNWDVVRLDEDETSCPETTVWVDRNELVAVARSSPPRCFTSRDYGRSWSRVEISGFRPVVSKMYAGRLSTGRYYLALNLPIENPVAGWQRRGVLAIAVSRPGVFAFEKVWLIQDFAAPGERPDASHYPSAIERDGKLYVVYTANVGAVRQCELAVIPVSALE